MAKPPPPEYTPLLRLPAESPTPEQADTATHKMYARNVYLVSPAERATMHQAATVPSGWGSIEDYLDSVRGELEDPDEPAGKVLSAVFEPLWDCLAPQHQRIYRAMWGRPILSAAGAQHPPRRAAKAKNDGRGADAAPRAPAPT